MDQLKSRLQLSMALAQPRRSDHLVQSSVPLPRTLKHRAANNIKGNTKAATVLCLGHHAEDCVTYVVQVTTTVNEHCPSNQAATQQYSTFLHHSAHYSSAQCKSVDVCTIPTRRLTLQCLLLPWESCPEIKKCLFLTMTHNTCCPHLAHSFEEGGRSGRRALAVS